MGVCKSKMLLPWSITTVWDLLITPEHMPIWLPFQRIVAEKNLPLHRGDRLTGYKKRLSPSCPHILMVEALEPYHSIQLYVVSSGVQRETIKIILDTDERTEGTWITYTRFAWLGTHQLMHWLDRWIVTPWMQCVVSVRGCIFFHRLYLLLERQQTALELAQESEAQRAARVEMEGKIFLYALIYRHWYARHE